LKRADKAAVAPRAPRKYRSTEGDDDSTLHLRLTAADRQRLRAILSFMLEDPDADRRERISYAGAVRYSMRHCVERPPAHVRPEGRQS
jgi:hypothetical protein